MAAKAADCVTACTVVRGSKHVQVVPGNNLTVIALTNFFQQLRFGSAPIQLVNQNQETRSSARGDGGEFVAGGVDVLMIPLPFRGAFFETCCRIYLVNEYVAAGT